MTPSYSLQLKVWYCVLSSEQADLPQHHHASYPLGLLLLPRQISEFTRACRCKRYKWAVRHCNNCDIEHCQYCSPAKTYRELVEKNRGSSSISENAASPVTPERCDTSTCHLGYLQLLATIQPSVKIEGLSIQVQALQSPLIQFIEDFGNYKA